MTFSFDFQGTTHSLSFSDRSQKSSELLLFQDEVNSSSSSKVDDDNDEVMNEMRRTLLDNHYSTKSIFDD